MFLKFAQTLDMIAHAFTFDEKRHKVVEFVQLMPTGNQMSILSSPLFISGNKMVHFIESFDMKFWILLFLSYTIITMLSIFKLHNKRTMLFVAMDYVILMIGRGTFKQLYPK